MSRENFLIVCGSLILSAAVSFALMPLFIRLAHRIGIVDVPKDNRRMHDHPIPMLGGLSIIAGFLTAAAAMALVARFFNFNSVPLQRLVQILPGAIIVAAISFLDDKYNLPALPRLLIQCGAAGLAVAQGVRITLISGSVTFFHAQTFDLGWLSVPITILWIVGITNAVNWIDGLDGLAGGVSSIAAFSMLLIAVFQAEPTVSVAILTAALCGGCFGFLPYNRHPAKVFMGDTGAMFLGFTLAVISVQGMLKIYAAVSFLVPIMILGLPLFDTASAIIRRLLKGMSPTVADRSHIHHKLVDMGLSQRQTVLLLYSLSGVLGLVAVFFSIYSTAVGWRFLLLGLAVVIFIFLALLFFVRRYNVRAAERAAACKQTELPPGQGGTKP